MAKIILNNVRITGKSGGTIKNYESVEITDSVLEFSERSIDFITDENVAIFRDAIKVMGSEDLIKLAAELKKASPSEQKKIIEKSKFQKLVSTAKDLAPLVKYLIETFRTSD